MPDDEELGAVAVEGGDGEVRVSGVASVNVGAVLVLGGEVRGGCLDEVGLKLGFAVFLAVDEALFADDGRVVVAGVAAGVAEVAPCQEMLACARRTLANEEGFSLTVGTAVSHVDVQNSNALGEVILVCAVHQQTDPKRSRHRLHSQNTRSNS